jgi:hypothetical protein
MGFLSNFDVVGPARQAIAGQEINERRAAEKLQPASIREGQRSLVHA